MRLSPLRILKHKFFKERDFVFEDKKFIGRFFRSYYFTGVSLVVGLMVFIQ